MKCSSHLIRKVCALGRIAALPEVHLLPRHRAPHAEEAPQVAQGPAVEGILVDAAVFEVGDAVARHELPRGGVQRHQVKMGTQEEQNGQR